MFDLTFYFLIKIDQKTCYLKSLVEKKKFKIPLATLYLWNTRIHLLLFSSVLCYAYFIELCRTVLLVYHRETYASLKSKYFANSCFFNYHKYFNSKKLWNHIPNKKKALQIINKVLIFWKYCFLCLYYYTIWINFN